MMNNGMGMRIRQLRKAKKLTIDEVSKRLGISASFLGLIERGKRSTGNDNIVKLCDMFNVSFEYIAFGKDEAEREGFNALSHMTLDEDEVNFIAEAAKIAIFYRFSKEELDLLLQGLNIHARSLNVIRDLKEA